MDEILSMIIHEETIRFLEMLFNAKELEQVIAEIIGSWIVVPFVKEPYMGSICKTQEECKKRSFLCRLN
jgi:hypothetical protein